MGTRVMVVLKEDTADRRVDMVVPRDSADLRVDTVAHRDRATREAGVHRVDMADHRDLVVPRLTRVMASRVVDT